MKTKEIFEFLILSQFGSAPEWLRIIMLLLLNATEYRLYVIEAGLEISAFLSKKKMWSSETMDNLPRGYLIGPDFIGWTDYSKYKRESELRIIGSKRLYDSIPLLIDVPTPVVKKDAAFEPLTEIKPANVYMLKLNDSIDHRVLYSHRFASEFTPTASQLRIVNDILRIYHRKKRVCVYIHGPPKTGKTTIAYLLNQHAEGTISTSFYPTSSRPGIFAHHQYGVVERGAACLVMRIDEADMMFDSITEGVTEEQVNGGVMVRNKADWNNFLDDFSIGIYPHTMLIMTSNKPPEYIHGLDPSYIRSGRVNAVFEMTEIVNFD